MEHPKIDVPNPGAHPLAGNKLAHGNGAVGRMARLALEQLAAPYRQNLGDDMTTNTTAAAVTESELFRQFLERDILEFSHTGKVIGRTPARNFLEADDAALNIFTECLSEVASGEGSNSTDALEYGIEQVEALAGYLKVLLREFRKACDEQNIPIPDDAPEEAPQLYRPLEDGTGADPDVSASGVVDFVELTPDDVEHIRRG